MSIKTRTALFSALTACALGASSSCVNEDYDLTKDFDKTISIDGDISAPIGNSETILIGDLLDLDEGDNDVLDVDESGNYSLRVSGNRTETTFNVPTFSITKDLATEGGLHGSVDRSEIMAEFGVTSVDLPLPAGLTVTREFKASQTPLTINESIPDEIADVKNVSGKAQGIISLQTNVNKATVSGLAIKFPEYLKIGDVNSTDRNINYNFDKGSNTLAFNPVEVTKSTRKVNVAISGIDFDRIPTGQGFQAGSHTIILNDNIKLSGFNVKVLSDDIGKKCSDIPEKVYVDVDINIGSINIGSAVIKVAPKVELAPATVKVGELPDFVNGEGTVLDLYNPLILLSVSNESPLSMTMDADLESFKGNSKKTVHIGAKGGATDEIRIEAGKTTNIHLSRTGKDAPENYTGIKVPDLSEIVKNVPERLGIANVDVKADDEFITVETGRTYSLYCDYEVIAPLAFGSGLKLEYSTDFTGWNETFNSEDGDSYEIRNADVTFDFVNMIPLGFGITASAIDNNKNVIPGIKVNVSGSVSSGSIDKPVRTPMTLNLKASSEDMRHLDGIRLTLKASGADDGHLGICLNKNQGIRLENMKLNLKGSFTTEL